MRYQFNETMPAEYISLQERSGCRKSDPLTAVQALRNTSFMVGICEGEELVAFGRIVGDDASYYLVCDIMVDERLQARETYAKLILKELRDYVLTTAPAGGKVLAFVDRPYDELCRQFGFKYLDEDYQAAMVRRTR